MRKKIKELDVVTLIRDIPEYKIKKGVKGTVVDIYQDGLAYEVEFINKSGHTDALFTLESDFIKEGI